MVKHKLSVPFNLFHTNIHTFVMIRYDSQTFKLLLFKHIHIELV